MIRMPIGSGASRPHRTARDRRNGARNASESLPAIPRITHWARPDVLRTCPYRRVWTHSGHRGPSFDHLVGAARTRTRNATAMVENDMSLIIALPLVN